jgi:hypothetical protein
MDFSLLIYAYSPSASFAEAFVFRPIRKPIITKSRFSFWSAKNHLSVFSFRRFSLTMGLAWIDIIV